VLLKEALDSVFAQTLQDFEIVITDNSDNDLTQKLAESYNDSRIRYFKNDGNIGAFLNLEKVCLLAAGNFIKILMDDDRLKPSCLEKMVLAMDTHSSVGLVMAPLEIIDERGKPATKVFYGFKRRRHIYVYQKQSALIDSKTIVKDFLTKKYPCCVPTGVMYRKSALVRRPIWDIRADFAVDVELSLHIAFRHPFFFINEPLTEWRYSSDSATVNFYSSGFRAEVFYYIVSKVVGGSELQALFNGRELRRIQSKAYLFASFRVLLNLLAVRKHGLLKTVSTILNTVWKHDPFKLHFLSLPFFFIKQVMGVFLENSVSDKSHAAN